MVNILRGDEKQPNVVGHKVINIVTIPQTNTPVDKKQVNGLCRKAGLVSLQPHSTMNITMVNKSNQSMIKQS